MWLRVRRETGVAWRGWQLGPYRVAKPMLLRESNGFHVSQDLLVVFLHLGVVQIGMTPLPISRILRLHERTAQAWLPPPTAEATRTPSPG